MWFADLSTTGLLVGLVLYLLVGAGFYAKALLRDGTWQDAIKTPDSKKVPLSLRAEAEGWVATKMGGFDGPMAQMFGPKWTDAPCVLRWAMAHATLRSASNAWLTLFAWPLVLVKYAAKGLAYFVGLAVLPTIRARALAEMELAFAKEEERERLAKEHVTDDKQQALNALLNRDGPDWEEGALSL